MCREETAERVQGLLCTTEFVWLGPAPGAEDTLRVTVTLVDGGAYTWVGVPFGGEELERYRIEGCSPELLEDLAECWTMYVLDPAWGRRDALWELFREALRGEGARPVSGEQW